MLKSTMLFREEAWILLCLPCVRIIRLENGWELVHQPDLEMTLELLTGGLGSEEPDL